VNGVCWKDRLVVIDGRHVILQSSAETSVLAGLHRPVNLVECCLSDVPRCRQQTPPQCCEPPVSTRQTNSLRYGAAVRRRMALLGT